MLGFAPFPSAAVAPHDPDDGRTAQYLDGSRAGVGAISSSDVFLVNDSVASQSKPASMLDRMDSQPVATARRFAKTWENPTGITGGPAQSGRGYSLGLPAGARLGAYQSGAVNEGFVPRQYRPAAVTLDGNPVENG